MWPVPVLGSNSAKPANAQIAQELPHWYETYIVAKEGFQPGRLELLAQVNAFHFAVFLLEYLHERLFEHGFSFSDISSINGPWRASRSTKTAMNYRVIINEHTEAAQH